MQRKLSIGYGRAAKIIDIMEARGFVSAPDGQKPREVLITKEQWASMRGGQPEQMNMDDLPFDEGVPEEID